MNVLISGFGVHNTQSFKMVGAGDAAAKKAQTQKKDDKKDNQNSTAAILTISNPTSKDRSIVITKRFQAMKENKQKQIETLNERIQKASEQGNNKLVEQLTDSAAELQKEYSALDEQLSTALFEEQQRKADEAKAKEEEAAREREKEQDKYKPDEEKIKTEERKSFEFFAKSDKAKESIQNSKIHKAMMERTKGRLEGEMAIDAARGADREQRQKARASEIANSVYEGGKLVKKGHSDVPYVSDKTILTEKKRIESGNFTADESASVKELNKLKKGIENFENSIGDTLSNLNDAVAERTEDAKDTHKSRKTTEAEAETEGKNNEGSVSENAVSLKDEAIEPKADETNES